MTVAVSTGKGPPALRLEDGRRRRGMSAGVGCLVLLGLTVGAVGHVAVHVKKLEVARELGVEVTLETQLLKEKRMLEVEVERLKSPARIETMARDKLKMGRPEFENIRVVGVGK